MDMRGRYIEGLVRDLVSRHRDELRQCIQPQVNVEESLRMIEHKLSIVLTKSLTKSLSHVEERFDEYTRKCVQLMEPESRDPYVRMKRAISTIEKQDRTNFKHGTRDVFDRKLAVNHRHRKALEKCFLELISDLQLQETDLQDLFFQKGFLSNSEMGSIKERRSTRERNSEFLNIICGRLTYEEFIHEFLPALNKDHPHLCQSLIQKIDQLEETEEYLCTSCRVKSNVQVKRIAASLQKKEAITMVQFSELASVGTSNRAKWEILLNGKISPLIIIDSLKEKYPDYHEEFIRFKRENLDCFCTDEHSEDVEGPSDAVSTVSYESVIDEDNMETVFFERFQERDSDKETGYEMKSKDHGCCLIINNVQFERDKLRARNGSERDGERLSETFRKLGFSVDLKNNLSSKEILDIIYRYSKQTDHSSSDTFVCCLLSHGKNDYIYGTDGVSITISRITAEFTACNCPSLAGKPKLFFIQADRGREKMKASVFDEDTSESAGAPGAGVADCRRAVADEADFLLGYCTAPGYTSYRSKINGSWYIGALCHVLESQTDRHDLLTCLTMVNDRIARTCVKLGDKVRTEQQVPAPVFTLRKKVFLTVDPAAAICASGY